MKATELRAYIEAAKGLSVTHECELDVFGLNFPAKSKFEPELVQAVMDGCGATVDVIDALAYLLWAEDQTKDDWYAPDTGDLTDRLVCALVYARFVAGSSDVEFFASTEDVLLGRRSVLSLKDFAKSVLHTDGRTLERFIQRSLLDLPWL